MLPSWRRSTLDLGSCWSSKPVVRGLTCEMRGSATRRQRWAGDGRDALFRRWACRSRRARCQARVGRGPLLTEC